MLLLNKVKGEDTVFKGTLYNEGTHACVVIENASNPDDIEVKVKEDSWFRYKPNTYATEFI